MHQLFFPYVFLAILTLFLLRSIYILAKTTDEYGVIFISFIVAIFSAVSCFMVMQAQLALNQCSF